jgi:betaine-aldehyde dehydrogenase
MPSDVMESMALLSGRHFVDGELIPGTGMRHPVIDPATERSCGEYAEATAEEVELAVEAASRAQREWWAMSALDRTVALHEVAARLEAGAARVGEYDRHA